MRRCRLKMARIVFLMVGLVVCVMLVSSSPAEREMTNDKVGYRETGWKSIKEGENRNGLDPQSIREKGRMLFAHFRQRARTLLTLKAAELKSAELSLDEMEENKKLTERYQYIAKEAEYEIKQYIVDAMSGDEPLVDPDLPRHSEEIAGFFMEALFASTYAEQTSKEDSMIQILKDILENKAH